ncbi:uncharacterized protein CELE_C17E7.12 [Caenorhabditis elegans]|uniref:Uncharacterized protein n=1 Tax=Caenorhabditis elegans TaxID=6239 RepID=Q965M6_CAEEL|nr:Uncharacterized protein CELE_C17E7.12 [Caenorhabditis elegans]CCD64878.1 Uncharacterized protein CELE_C17E7.12 [Caenorhabditis elegans]|eukprot:NP_504074.1 Uncharacterized protein CELE_C17E7.12 [Caenorhabditis elegans]
MDNVLNIKNEEDWKFVLPTFGPAAGITLLVAAVSFSCLGYHFYRKRQAAIEESKRQGAENRQIHENMRREREASMSPQDMPIEMQNF